MKTLTTLRNERGTPPPKTAAGTPKQLAVLLGYLDSCIAQTAGDVRRLRRQIARRERLRES